MNAFDQTVPRWVVVALAVGILGMALSGVWIFNSGPDPNPSRRLASSSIPMITGGASSPPTAEWLLPDDDEMSKEVRAVLQRQVAAWNNGDLEEFMQTYWRSEALTFSSGGRTQRGWQATLDRYRQRYPAGAMGTLRFDELEFYRISDQWALVLGRWFLTGPPGELEGNFTLVVREVGDAWFIVHDHSSSLDKGVTASGANGSGE